MIIIDANNLAGKLDLLEEKNFDRLLIDMIKKYNQDKLREIFLVFDSIDPMGDKFKEGNLTIIYTPCDNYYKGADDKIVELAEQFKNKQNLKIITDDIDIKERIKKLNLDLKLVTATEFARKLEYFFNEDEDSEDNLSENKKDSINKELLNIWK